METVPETETPGETRTAVVLMLIGPTIIKIYHQEKLNCKFCYIDE